MIGFGHIFSFLAKGMLEPMRPLVTTLQGRLVEALVSTKLKRYEMRLICSFKACTRKLLVYQNWKEGLKNVHVFCSRQRNRENYQEESAAQYWKRAVAIPFLDVIC